MDKTERHNQIMKALLASIISARGGPLPMNSGKLDSMLARLLSNPEFKGLKVTLRELKGVYKEIADKAIQTQINLKKM